MSVAGTVDLTTGQILQYNNAAITADKLVVRSNNYAGLSGTRNSINTLALASTGGNFDFQNNKALSIGTVNGVVGLTTANGHAKLDALGNITLDDKVNLGSGHLGLFAAGHTIDLKNKDFNNDGVNILGALGLQANAVTNFIGTPAGGPGGAVTPSHLKFLAVDLPGDFRFQAADELTVGNVWGLLGVKATGNIWLTTGVFGASGAIPAFNIATAPSAYRDGAPARSAPA
jgi:hypothetical protein